MPGFTCSGGAADPSSRPQNVAFDVSQLPVASSSDASCKFRGADACSMMAAAKSMMARSSRVSSEVAVRHEIQRTQAAREIVKNMIAIIDEAIIKPATVGAKNNARNSAANIASGLFPALVFEYLALHDDLADGNGAAMDPVIPCAKVFPKSVAHSITKRLTPFVHDLLRCRGDAVLQKCNEVSSNIVKSLDQVTASLSPSTTMGSSCLVTVSERRDDGGVVTISCGDFQHTLLITHYEKLRRLYIGKPEEFPHRVFVMCQRYFVLTGSAEDPAQEGGWHGSVPPQVMQLLSTHDECHFGGECFASPFNASSNAYYSAFPDADCYFGSVGSFFGGPAPNSGLFEANPPFEHSTVMAMARRMIALLNASCEPLAFLIVLPWADKGKTLGSTSPFRVLVEESGLLGGSLDLAGAQTPYVDGYQQSSRHSAFTSRLDTRLLLLHNRAHFAALHSQQSVQAFLESIAETWCIGKKRVRDDS